MFQCVRISASATPGLIAFPAAPYTLAQFCTIMRQTQAASCTPKWQPKSKFRNFLLTRPRCCPARQKYSTWRFDTF